MAIKRPLTANARPHGFSAAACARKFTLIEMLVVISIISVLAALLTPALRQSLDRGQTIVCLNNLKTELAAFTAYTQDYHNYLPNGSWGMQIAPYLLNKNAPVWNDYANYTLRCPQVPRNPKENFTLLTSYAIPGSYWKDSKTVFAWKDGGAPCANCGTHVRLRKIVCPTRKALLVEFFPDWSGTQSIQTGFIVEKEFLLLHNGLNSSNFLFMDGHMKTQDVPSMTYDLSRQYPMRKGTTTPAMYNINKTCAECDQ